MSGNLGVVFWGYFNVSLYISEYRLLVAVNRNKM